MNKFKKAFTLSCRTFRSDFWSAILRSRKTKLHSSGFTLAEIIVTLTLLGAIAVITVPTALNKSTLKGNRTKLLKAISSYEKMLEETRVTEGITSEAALRSYFSDNNCANLSKHIKTIKIDGCQFQTYDKLWWDVGTQGNDVFSPIISFKKENLKTENAENKDDLTSFYMVTTFDENSKAYRINDLAYETAANHQTNKTRLEKLLGFANNTTYSSNENNAETPEETPEETPAEMGSCEFAIQAATKYIPGFDAETWNSCGVNSSNIPTSIENQPDEDSSVIYFSTESYSISYSDDGETLEITYRSGLAGGAGSTTYKFNKEGVLTESYYTTTISSSRCKEHYKYIVTTYDENGNGTTTCTAGCCYY